MKQLLDSVFFVTAVTMKRLSVNSPQIKEVDLLITITQNMNPHRGGRVHSRPYDITLPEDYYITTFTPFPW